MNDTPKSPTSSQSAELTCSATECPICKGDYAIADLAFRLGHRPDVAFANLAKCQKDKLSGLDEMIYAVVYKDDGPSGICGQSCSITSPWTHLYLFSNYKAVKDFIDKIKNQTGRKNARVEFVFHPHPDANEIFVVGE